MEFDQGPLWRLALMVSFLMALWPLTQVIAVSIPYCSSLKAAVQISVYYTDAAHPPSQRKDREKTPRASKRF